MKSFLGALLLLSLSVGAVAQSAPLPLPVTTPSGPTAPAPVFDPNNAPFYGVVSITPGTPLTVPTRSLGYVCTGSGNVTLTLFDGSSLTVYLASSTAFQTLPFYVTNVAAGGPSCTYWGLK